MLLAVGLSSGKIMVSHEATCQILRSLSHGGRIRFLQSSDKGGILTFTSLKAIDTCDVKTWECLRKFKVEAEMLTITFLENDARLLTTLNNNVLIFWNSRPAPLEN